MPFSHLIASSFAAWPATIEEARAVQESLRDNVCMEVTLQPLHTVLGVDVSYNVEDNISHAVIVWMQLEELKPLKIITAQLPTTFPYIPGFLSFREIPVILKALMELSERPDFIMVDGHGIAHPRRLGIAAHLGVILDIPTIGVAKSRLIGSYTEPGINKGDQSPLFARQEQIGTVLRSKDNTKPLFISPGHRIDHSTAIKLTLECLTRYRLPEPTRIADKLSKQVKLKDELVATLL